MKYLAALVMFLTISGCVANPPGSTWAVADMDKYDHNYAPFPTSKLIIGSSRQETTSLFNYGYETIEASSAREVIAYHQWVSVEGPDYIEKTLYLTFQAEKLESWKIAASATSVVPRRS